MTVKIVGAGRQIVAVQQTTAPRVAAHAVYVYYKVAEESLADMLKEVHAMQARLLVSQPEVRAGLQRRAEPADGQVTLMETYQAATAEALGKAFMVALTAAAAGLPKPRHVETFIPV